MRRESVEIFTKVYLPTGDGPNDRGLSRKHIMESINGSLKRLQTDYVDLYQAHRYDYETPLEETMQAFADVVRQGKALYIGVSEWTADEIRAGAALARELGIHLVSNQPQYSMLWRVIEKEVVPTCEELGLGQIAGHPWPRASLTGNTCPARRPGASRFTGENGKIKSDNRYLTEDILTRVQQLKPLAADAGLSMPALAVAWVLQNPNVSAAIVGASRPDQLKDTATAAGVKLDPALLAQVDEVLDPVIERDPAKVESFPARP